MKKRNFFYCISLLTITTILSTCNKIPKNDIVYIDKNTLFQKFSKIVTMQSNIQLRLDPDLHKINIIKKDMESLQLSYNTMSVTLSQSQKTDLKNKMKNLDQQYKIIFNKMQNTKKQLNNKLMTPIYNEINSILKIYGETKNYKLILAANPDGNILYANKKIDKTDDFLIYLEKNKSDKIINVSTIKKKK